MRSPDGDSGEFLGKGSGSVKHRVFPLVVAVCAVLLPTGNVLAAAPSAAGVPALVGRSTLPYISAAFSAAQVPVSTAVTASFSIKNPDTHPRTSVSVGVFFTVQVTPSAPRAACGGTLTTSGSGVTLVGATIAPSGTCQITGIGIPTSQPGVIQLQTANVLSDVAPGNAAAASIDVFQAPAMSAVFSPASIAAGSTSVLTFTVTNPAVNTFVLTGVWLGGKLPTGITVANTAAAATSCGGQLTTNAPDLIRVNDWAIPQNGSCQVSVTVTSGPVGTYKAAAGLDIGGTSSSVASATLTVTAPAPVVTAAPPVETPVPTPSPAASIGASSSIAPSTLPSASASPSAAAVVAVASASAAPSVAAASTGDSPNSVLLILVGAMIGAAAVLAGGGLIAALWLRRRRVAVPVDPAPES
jgi:hypothetical protein